MLWTEPVSPDSEGVVGRGEQKVQIFQIFFRALQLPAVESLDPDVNQLREHFVKLLRDFMKEKVLGALRVASDG